MTWKDYLADAEQKLVDAGVEDAQTNVEYLAANVLGLSERAALRGKLNEEVSQDDADAFNALLLRRINREPLQYILGEWEFYGIPVTLNSSVLIPRPETEILVEQALKEAKHFTGRISVLDIGTGSGCIAIALAKYLPKASMLGVDLSEAAVQLARRNADRVLDSHFRGNDKIIFRVADIFSDEWIEGRKFDLIVSNPPYISRADFETLEPELKDFEPRAALTDESDGLTFYKRIAEVAPNFLSKNGRLLVELGYGMAGSVTELMLSVGLEVLRIENDLAGVPRVITVGLHATAL